MDNWFMWDVIRERAAKNTTKHLLTANSSVYNSSPGQNTVQKSAAAGERDA